MKLKIEKESLNDVYKNFADLIGVDNMMRIFDRYRGQQISFPVELYSKQYIYNQIINEYDGANLKKLATKYGYSERTVRRILKDIDAEQGGSK